MEKFLIEVAHEAEKSACLKAAQILLKSGSHFVTNADFGCLDGEHKAWIVVDSANKEEARAILPPEYRSSAKIIQLNKFDLKEIEKLLGHHQE
jgi:replicative superfamily II helicase